MRRSPPFHSSFLCALLVSTACHGVALAGLWWARAASSPPDLRPFARGDHSVRLRWVAKRPRPPREEPPPRRVTRPPRRPPPPPVLKLPPARREVPSPPPEKPPEKPPEARPQKPPEKAPEKPPEAHPQKPPPEEKQPPPKRQPPPIDDREGEILADLRQVVLKEPPPPAGVPGARQGASLLSALAPHYPKRCRRRRHEGKVLIECRVDANGRVSSARVIASAGCRELDDSALTALQGARFRPAQRGGKPVPGTVVQPVVFKLR